ncbi:MAG: hypothetical protein ACI9WU_001976 [Myxococcota bacterium]|jgi:hypothetical protein
MRWRVFGVAVGILVGSACVSLGCSDSSDAPVSPEPVEDVVQPEADTGPVDRASLPRNPEELIAAAPVLRRVSAAQYGNLLRDWFGPDLELPGTLEPDVRVDRLYAVGAGIGGLSGLGADRYFKASRKIAGQLIEIAPLRAVLGNCDGTSDPDGCLTTTIETWTLRLWRRPATQAEVARLKTVADGAIATLGAFDEGLRYAMMAILTSPHFVYVHGTGTDSASPRAYTSWEMAERLALFLWASGPDQALLDVAAADGLVDDESLRAVIQTMMADPRARRGLRVFSEDWLALDELEELSKDPALYVHFTPDFGEEAREETLRLVEHLAFDIDTDFRTLLTTRTTFLTRRLASVYAVPATVVDGFGQVTLPADGPRAGLLGHASVLSLYATPNRSSPTLRGRFVREHLLCQTMPEPPANVDTTIPEASASAPTMRERLAGHLEIPGCASCHLLTDPVGLGLEQFDGLGAYRTTENDAIIDPTGDLDGHAFLDGAGVGEAVANHPALVPCLVDTVWAYANGRTRSKDDRAQTLLLGARFAASGHRLLTLLEDVAMSDGFRHLSSPEAN